MYYSQWHHLKKAVAWILRIKSALKACTNTGLNDKSVKREKGPLTAENLQEVEAAITQFCQSTSCMDEMTALKNEEEFVQMAAVFFTESPLLRKT